jgi:hypothetical protein
MASKDYSTTEANTNQGIVDGRQAGQFHVISLTLQFAYPLTGANPEPAPVTLDTYVDKDASVGSFNTTDNAIHGATSADVHNSIGKPGFGETSQELHHNGQHGGKRQAEGVSQWGPPGQKDTELSRAERVTGERDDMRV